MPSLPSTALPIAAPILGSKPYSAVQLGASITPSRVMNSCTRISPISRLHSDLWFVSLPIRTGHPQIDR